MAETPEQGLRGADAACRRGELGFRQLIKVVTRDAVPLVRVVLDSGPRGVVAAVIRFYRAGMEAVPAAELAPGDPLETAFHYPEGYRPPDCRRARRRGCTSPCVRSSRPARATSCPGRSVTRTRSSSPPASSAASDALARVERRVVRCRACPRLVAHRERVARDEGRALPRLDLLGSTRARLRRSARAAARGRARAGGARRQSHRAASSRATRAATGSTAALHRAGFANQPTSVARDDGLRLRDAYVTAVARCAPPGNRPTPDELATCRRFLVAELALLRRLRVVVVLGKIAHDGFLAAARLRGVPCRARGRGSRHGAEHRAAGRAWCCSARTTRASRTRSPAG